MPKKYKSPALLKKYSAPNKDELATIVDGVVADVKELIESTRLATRAVIQSERLDRLEALTVEQIDEQYHTFIEKNDVPNQTATYLYLCYRDLSAFRKPLGLITDKQSLDDYAIFGMYTRNSAHSEPLANVLDALEKNYSYAYQDAWTRISNELHAATLPVPPYKTPIGNFDTRLILMGQESNFLFNPSKNLSLYEGKSLTAGNDEISLEFNISDKEIESRLNLLDRLMQESIATILLESVDDPYDVLDRRIYPVTFTLREIFRVMTSYNSAQLKPTQTASMQRSLARQGATRIVIDLRGVALDANHSWDADFQSGLAVGSPALHFNDITAKRNGKAATSIQILECPILLRYALYHNCIDRVSIGATLKKNRTETILAVEEFWNDRLTRCKRQIREEAKKKKPRASHVVLRDNDRTLTRSALCDAIGITDKKSKAAQRAQQTLLAFVKFDVERDQRNYAYELKGARGRGAKAGVRGNGYLQGFREEEDRIVISFE